MVVKNKRGQEMSISTLVIIVIAIIVLVLVVLGFTMGWQNLWNKFNIFGGTSGGLADVVSSCKVAVSTDSTVSYCNEFRKVKLPSGDMAYYNCAAKDVDDALKSDGVKTLGCGTGDSDLVKFCITLKSDKGVLINGKTCTYTAATGTAIAGCNCV